MSIHSDVLLACDEGRGLSGAPGTAGRVCWRAVVAVYLVDLVAGGIGERATVLV
jgi:hypothetical protein